MSLLRTADVRRELAMASPGKHDSRPNYDGLMLAHRRRRWANFSPALGQRAAFVGKVTMNNFVKQPSKHEKLNQHWVYVGPASQTMGLHWPNPETGSTSRVCWEEPAKANTWRWIKTGLMLGERRRRWTNNEPTTGHIVVSGLLTSAIFTRSCDLRHAILSYAPRLDWRRWRRREVKQIMNTMTCFSRWKLSVLYNTQ